MKPPANLAPHQLTLRFYDVEATLRADSGTPLRPFLQTHDRFQANGTMEPASTQLEFVILTGSVSPWKQPVLLFKETAWPLPNSEQLADCIYVNVLNTIVAHIRSHILIHAGVVARNGQGVIIVADSGHGKTTLVLELVRRGFQFLSDESAALGRADRRVYPFPRRLGIRPKTLNLVGLTSLVADLPAVPPKLHLDVEQIRPDSLGRQSVPIRHIVILRDPAKADVGTADDSAWEMAVFVDRLDDNFVAAVRDINGVTAVQAGVQENQPLLRLKSRRSRQNAILAQIETLCQPRHIWMMDVATGVGHRPSFDQPARLEAISHSQAVKELLWRFQGGARSAILEELGGSSSRLFLELAGLISQANCYYLNIGPLPQAADLVAELADKA